MARKIERLSPLAVARAKAEGLYADGGNLYLQVAAGGARSWIFRFRRNGRTTPRDLGLGPAHTVTLAEARTAAAENRKLLLEGVDPIEAKREKRAEKALEAASAVTFRDAADRYIAAHAAGWRNEKHGAQWTATLTAYAHPTLGALPVATIEVGHVLKVLEPIWSEKPETASRVRGRVESILDWATARGYRRGDNPARWRGHLENLLPRRDKVARVRHHPALRFLDIGAFMVALRAEQGIAARALEFLVLTAARTSEVIGATWPEIDIDNAVWTVPADRIKAGREHRVPLSAPAMALLRRLYETRAGDHVFPGGKSGRPLSNNAILALLERMGRGDVTAHGFRSTFRDWAAERTAYPREVAEMALAHIVDDKVEAAYRRGDLIEKRRRMMADWATFCDAPTERGAVVPIAAGRAEAKAAKNSAA